MKAIDFLARGIAGSILAAVFLLAMEHWNDETLRAKGCIATGTPGVETKISDGISVVGRVWFCKEKTP